MAKVKVRVLYPSALVGYELDGDHAMVEKAEADAFAAQGFVEIAPRAKAKDEPKGRRGAKVKNEPDAPVEGDEVEDDPRVPDKEQTDDAKKPSTSGK